MGGTMTMSMQISFPDRVFQMWSYSVSMSRLLLRSTKGESGDRIDVAFQNVQALRLPTLLEGLEVRIARDDESRRITDETGLLPSDDHTFFVLVGSNYFGHVVAGVVTTSTDDREYYEPSAVWPDEPHRLS